MTGNREDLGALAYFTNRYRLPLEHWVRLRMPRSLRASVDVPDLVRAAMAASIEDPDHHGGPDDETAFLTRARRNLQAGLTCAIAHRPGSAGRRTESETLQDPDVSSSLLDRYDMALTHLTPTDRDAIILRIELGLPWPDVVTLLKKSSASAAQIAVSRALVRLAREMAL
jgi:DNA-directed RNA polymerase specialized sigma24 family protein